MHCNKSIIVGMRHTLNEREREKEREKESRMEYNAEVKNERGAIKIQGLNLDKEVKEEKEANEIMQNEMEEDWI